MICDRKVFVRTHRRIAAKSLKVLTPDEAFAMSRAQR